MNKYFHFLFLPIMTSILFACNSSDRKRAEVLQTQVDSLMSVNQEQKNELNNMSTFIGTLSMGLDSIKSYEDSLFYSNPHAEGPKVTKEQMKERLNDLKLLLERQKAQIAHLRQELENEKGEKTNEMKKLVDYYEAQISQKDEQIRALQAELYSKNLDISQLRTRIGTLTSSNQQLEQKSKQIVEVLEVQNQLLNTGYVQIGTKKELKAKGLLTGGFLSKTKVDTSKLLEGNFNQVDIRNFNDIVLSSKNPKILTQMPVSSYQLNKNSDGTTILHITDPTAFWSVSNFLIIQL